ncbi:hypothetical protein CIG75_12180 [Tumebacillus algifaecis]|uniref:Uncharacterized protein n=1 Tax=Tumebacillus algifaecis TaxID=1214604 RepID=A0A223D234_9BACL|nr:hypothetical protein [Tumebacillus algifaecis]ASS75672.1 hypothetical protein CIG75_12180 [Tumebacillus algifaecis]
MKMGSPLWRFRYRTRRQPWLLLIPLLLVIILFIGSCALLGGGGEGETVTVGQSVLDGWLYGGFDSSGNLIFRQGDQVVLLPQGSTEVKLNGNTLHITRATSNTLELQIDSTPSTHSVPPTVWWAIGSGVFGFILGRLRIPTSPISSNHLSTSLPSWKPRRWPR